MKATTSTRIQINRATLRKAGLRLGQIRVPDTRRAGFTEACRRQSLLVQRDTHEQETTIWLEALADREGWQ